MKLRMFTLFDTMAECHSKPHFFKTTGEALRAITDAANSGDDPIAKHSKDYVVYELGVYDDNSGMLMPYENPKKIMNVGDLVSAQTDIETIETTRKKQ